MIIIYKFNDGNKKDIEYNDPGEIEKILNEIKFFAISNVTAQKFDFLTDMRNKFDITIDGEKIKSDSNKIVSIEIKLK